MSTSDDVKIGDAILIRAGEIIPVDGLITSPVAVVDEAALTGEPIPVTRQAGESARSGTLNAGDTFEITATATAEESTYAGIVRLVTAAQTAKAPFIRLADRYALLLLPVTILVAGLAWALSGDPIRGLAVLVVATPCPLILAAPVAFIAGVSQAARRGIIIKGGAPLDALAQTHTVLFDKTGTLTVGGARLIAVETAPDEDADEVLRLAGSLEQASQHVVAAAIVAAAAGKGLPLQMPQQVHEVMGSGLEGIVDWAEGPRRLAPAHLRRAQAGRVGGARVAPRILAVGAQRVRVGRWPRRRRVAACRRATQGDSARGAIAPLGRDCADRDGHR